MGMSLLLVVGRSRVGWLFLEVCLNGYVRESHFLDQVSLSVLLDGQRRGYTQSGRGEEVVMSIEHKGIYKCARRRAEAAKLSVQLDGLLLREKLPINHTISSNKSFNTTGVDNVGRLNLYFVGTQVRHISIVTCFTF